MSRSPRAWLAAVLIGSGCLLTAASSAPGQDKKEDPAKGEMLLSKSEALTADDEKDTKLKQSHRKVYTIKLSDEVTKDFLKKGENVTLKDAQLAAQLSMTVDEVDIDFARSTIRGFIKIFDGAADKKLTGLSRFLEGELKKLERIGTEIEIA